MRITGGKLKGRVIKCPDGIIRPAMDRMRESVFAILGDLDGKSWLDLFSGSGTIAIEAVSRGSKEVQLCEKDKIKVKQVLENVSITEKELGVKIGCHFMAVELFLKRCKDKFDYIFLDPPFPYKYRLDLLKIIEQRQLVKEGGFVMIHYPEEDALPEEIGTLTLKDKRIYGRSIVNFYSF
ncbi:16S rRNA (guanine(966)-N(2))-methyltransferase RsmD [Treponema ruminis]|uniref:16S rRNA (Guanine(966)-N(2))-methyltransferase RsmD n=1 Tax=Treponema ruminis TaxID=744515 RepID=A0A7W8G7A8_9SPIR|nr:16S rRNA (guanine(966)-N(2))-methyltransferase RsmD [Treponema ruminis]MBB5225193.1 16S rRNA (guanine(966)-N(2))-methyltransferase RsmD [Treponema ruminis]QSI01937.1 16S rRNA (guanine(966)-N(2))-methyltransferase RsmD [Treponema ruminis]